MSISCPNCGVEIVGVVIGSSPFPGWQPPPQSGANGRNPTAQPGTQSEVAHGSEASSSRAKRPYNQDYPSEFLKFWNIYPRKRDKRKALASWRNAIRRSSTDAINAGAIRYRDDPNRLDEYTKYAEGWLNGDGWEDEPLPARLPRGVEPSAPKPMTDSDYRREATVAELREQMAAAIRDQMTALARLRSSADPDVLSYLTQTYRENAGLSVGTGMESYWLLMVDVATHEVVPR